MNSADIHIAMNQLRESGMDARESGATVAQYNIFCIIVTQTCWDPYLAAERLVILGTDIVLAARMAYKWCQDEANH